MTDRSDIERGEEGERVTYLLIRPEEENGENGEKSRG